MSRGPGHVQQAILKLIADDRDGAWSYAEFKLNGPRRAL
jgi:hypothetical protein